MTGGHATALGLALFAAVMWGLWWVPIRMLEGAGLHGVWPGLAMAAGALPAFAIAAARGGRARAVAGGAPVVPPRSEQQRALAGAVACGLAVMLYASALAFTDVVRAVLLFYLAPAWSTAIECLFLGRRWSRRSALALGLGACGVMAILRLVPTGEGVGVVWNAGDSMALASGLAWSVGTALIFTAPTPGSGRLSLAMGLGALCAGLAIAFSGDGAGAMPDLSVLVAALPLALVTGLVYLAPVILGTMWSAQRLPPATLSFLLTAEIISGVGSSALFLDEPFGWPEMVGTVLVTLGALVEVVRAPRHPRLDHT
ncbi:DMT family transporter [Limibaculum sp. M0105]|uniref:DMT family transporter n=1 Tax=Thermohalobaculum xanthum TaxID=2753746 RepID=A0A8J7SE53_9RHOB|nr:DMT family transporter [Thermohalobaculum xanthum]MBK0398772.1 DMT family transporter [Thermohalobaculum xanthum]